MIFAQNNSINQSFLSENSTTYLTLQTACLKLKAGPNLAHFSSSTKFSPLRRGRAEFGQREFALGRRIQKQTLHLKKDCVWAQIYMQPTQPTSTKLPLSYSYFFFNNIFSNANFSFLFPKFYYFYLNHTTSKKPYLLLIETRLTRCYQNCCFFHETLLKCGNSIKFTPITPKNVWNKRYPSKN